MTPLRVLCVGHSYVLAVNRGIVRELSRDPSFSITVGAPHYFHGDLRSLACEPEPEGSRLKVVPLTARMTKHIHVFRYNGGELRQLLQPGSFDCVHAWEEPYVFAGYQIARAAGRSKTPYCFRTAQSLNKKYPLPFAYFEKSALRVARRWIAGGTSVFDNLVKRGYPAEHGRIITLAVDTAAFQPVSEAQRRAVQSELGLTGPMIVFLGRLVEAKGLRILTAALEQMDRSLPWSLLLLGSGPMKSELEQWAESRGWASRVRVQLVKHDEVPRYLAAADLMVAPSQTMPNWKEQFGRMLIEAFACAIPVLASDSGEIPHVVGSSGLIVGEKDVAGWRDAIARLLADSGLRQRLGQAGLARIDEFSVKTVAKQFGEFYRELAACGVEDR